MLGCAWYHAQVSGPTCLGSWHPSLQSCVGHCLALLKHWQAASCYGPVAFALSALHAGQKRLRRTPAEGGRQCTHAGLARDVICTTHDCLHSYISMEYGTAILSASRDHGIGIDHELCTASTRMGYCMAQIFHVRALELHSCTHIHSPNCGLFSVLVSCING